MQTNPQLDLAYDFIQTTGVNVFLTGKAGTGKTTFLKSLRELSPKRMIVVAPTGVAAINAGGVTIHSFFQLPFTPHIPLNFESKSNFQQKFSREKINIIRSIDLLVIDEISMVRADLLDAVSDTLRRFRNREKPFGGVQLLLIGDIQQLAPVVKDDEWDLLKTYYSSPFFFDSNALKQSQYVSIELKHVYRQSDQKFIDLLNKIRDNNFDSATLAELNKRYKPNFKPTQNQGYITLTTHNYIAQKINAEKLAALKQKLFIYTAEIADDFPEYLYPTDNNLELKLGAQVMFVKNDSSPEKEYYNGKIGTITIIKHDEIVVTDDVGNEINVHRETWENMKFSINPQTKEIDETLIGTFTQYPLKTAWAITIHKSQGLTFEHAIIDAASAFSHGQVYVALSRCKTLEGLVLSTPLTQNAMINDNRINNFTTQIGKNEPTREQQQNAQKQYFTDLLCNLFDFSKLQHNLQYATKIYAENLKTLYPLTCKNLSEKIASFYDDITKVGERFQQQLRNMINFCGDYISNENIQDRIRKGATYFLDLLNTENDTVATAKNAEIDNKETKKVVFDAFKNADSEMNAKLASLDYCTNGFCIKEFLENRAKNEIDDTKKAKTKKAEKAKTETKVDDNLSDIKHIKLYELLRFWRKETALDKGVPAYFILKQKTLVDIANLLPKTEKELTAIKGIGKQTAKIYGKEIMDIINEYCQENEDFI